jgi:hypothetical protein
MSTPKAPVEEEDAGKLQLGPGARWRRRCTAPHCARSRMRSHADFQTYPPAKGMMLAEVKLVMDSKIAGDKEKGEETPTTKTKCVRGAMRDAVAAAAHVLARGLQRVREDVHVREALQLSERDRGDGAVHPGVRALRFASPSARSRRVAVHARCRSALRSLTRSRCLLRAAFLLQGAGAARPARV